MFAYDKMRTFEMFSLSHLFVVLFMVAVIIFLAVFRKYFMNNKRADKILKFSIAGVILLLELIFRFWEMLREITMETVLPLELCFICLVLTVVGVFSGKKWLNKIAFIWGSTGAFLSVLLPGMNYEFPHFRYIHYFGAHMGFFVLNLYMVITKQITYTYKDILKISGLLILVAFPIFLLDYFTGLNYMYMHDLPKEVNFVVGWFGYPGYVPFFVFIIFVTFNITYGIYWLINLLAKKRAKQAFLVP